MDKPPIKTTKPTVKLNPVSEPKIDLRDESVERAHSTITPHVWKVLAGVVILILGLTGFRTFTVNRENATKTQAVQQIKRVALACHIYTADYDDLLPLADDFNAIILPYTKDENLFFSAHPSNTPLAYNPNLSAVSISSLESPSDTPMLRDSSPWDNNGVLYAFVDAHTKFLYAEDAEHTDSAWNGFHRRSSPLASTSDQQSRSTATESWDSDHDSDQEPQRTLIESVPFYIPTHWIQDSKNSHQWQVNDNKDAFVRVIFSQSDDESAITSTINAESERFSTSSAYQYEKIDISRVRNVTFPAWRWKFRLNNRNKGWMYREMLYCIYNRKTIVLSTGISDGYEHECGQDVTAFLKSIERWDRS